MYIQKKLKNGLTYVLSPLQETEAITVLILVKAGSRSEDKTNNGISHFIEHLLFKGTTNRPNSFILTKELDSLGAEYNAFTDKDHTGYYIKVAKQHLAKAIEILSDMLFNPLFEEKEITKERGVIIEEINMYDDNPMMLSGDVLEQALFPNSPLGRRIIGPKENIQKITRKQIFDYYSKHYFTTGVLIGVAGNFNKVKATELIKKYFGEHTVNGKPKKYIPADKISKLSIKALTRPINQVQVGLAMRAYKRNDPRIYPLAIIASVLGGGMSSRLFVEIRENNGLAYFIKAGTVIYEDAGALVIQAGLDASRFEPALKLIKAELIKMADKGITASELRTAKEFIKGHLVLPLEDSARLISWLLDQQLFSGKIETVAQKIKKIEAVSLAAANKVAKDVIKLNNLACSYIGPAGGEKIIRKIF